MKVAAARGWIEVPLASIWIRFSALQAHSQASTWLADGVSCTRTTSDRMKRSREELSCHHTTRLETAITQIGTSSVRRTDQCREEVGRVVNVLLTQNSLRQTPNRSLLCYQRCFVGTAQFTADAEVAHGNSPNTPRETAGRFAGAH